MGIRIGGSALLLGRYFYTFLVFFVATELSCNRPSLRRFAAQLRQESGSEMRRGMTSHRHEDSAMLC